MNTRFIFISILSSIILFASCREKHGYYSFDGYAQGSAYHITLNTTSSRLYQKEIDSILAAIDNSLSVYNPKSTVSLINTNTNPAADSILKEIFTLSKRFSEETDGLFDVSCAPLFDFWGFGDTNDTLFLKMTPEQRKTEVDSIRKYTGMEKFAINGNTVSKPSPKAKLNFNAIAQGYTCDVIGKFLESKGISDYLVEVGGEILCKGNNPKGENWSIAIDRPIDGNMEPGVNIQEIIKITGKGVVTSGNYRKYIMEQGEKFSHTINPKTGFPVRNSLLSATVIADDATTADAYATYFMVIGLEKAKSILSQRDDLEGYLIYSDSESENGMSVYYSKGLKILTLTK